ncbi:MAG: amidohydrolase [Chitinophagales bacterium]|nr:amidohydrolase [Chitinophagales bacterium]
MPCIDIHTHIIPENMPRWSQRFGYEGFIHLEHHAPCRARMMRGKEFFREIESNCWDPEQRIRECAAHQVTMQVLSTIPVMFSYWARPADALELSRFLNDHLAEVVQRYPRHFLGLATVPLQDVGLAVKELERCRRELSLCGVQIGTNVNQLNLSEPQFHEFFAAAQDLDACIFIHPWDMMGGEHLQKYWLPWLVGMPAETARAICSLIFGGVLERFPRLRLAFAHGGGAFPATFGRIAHGFEERPDLVAVDNERHPAEYLGRFWFDSLTHDEAMLHYLIRFAGEDRVCLGSDYPFPLGERQPGKLIREAALTDAVRKKLLWSNAWHWLQGRAPAENRQQGATGQLEA